jgi:phosphate:Na+ symporter
MKRDPAQRSALSPRYVAALAITLGIVMTTTLVWPVRSLAQDGTVTQLEVFPLFMGMFGGLALFLYGMDQMSDAMKLVAGIRMRDILRRLTSTRLTGFLTGVVTTAVLQSSSVVTVMLVGFINAGLMSFSQAVAVILGSDVGTTITVQIIAFKVTHYALLLVGIGFLLAFAVKSRRVRLYGQWILGLGLLFFGMNTMSATVTPLRDYEPFIQAMTVVSSPLLAVLVATLFTGLIQTSAATIGIAIVLASQGLIDLNTGIALILGANIGTCVTAGLAAIGKPREAVRAAVAHVFFKVIGTLIVLPFIPYLGELVIAVSPKPGPGMDAAAIATDIVPRQIANAHTIFNLGVALFFLPFSTQLVRIIEWLIPDKAATTKGKEMVARYLDETMIDTPTLALGLVRREVNRMGDVLEEMLQGIPDAVFAGDLEKMAKIQDLDNRVDALYEIITQYLAKIGREDLTDRVSDNVLAAMTAITELESIGDIMENNLAHLAEVCASGNIRLEGESLRTLQEFHSQVLIAFNAAISAFVSDNSEAAQIVMDMKDPINRMDTKIRGMRARGLHGSTVTPEDLASYTVQVDIVENLKRVYYHTKRVAKLVVKEEGAAAWVEEE